MLAGASPSLKRRLLDIADRTSLTRTEVVEAALEAFECYCLGIELKRQNASYSQRGQALSKAAKAIARCDDDWLKDWGEALGTYP